ncbi:hypothetical protein CDAR_35391 [Caerostris darwini]|uniref:Uncharacterized protein n=1 Tax=Caerostris darwini TaxID=1538125 RepID=A0AAV4SMB2_9ARAC|nr:hypothetical protein CDAR_35391 [Caerostris darwini]
MINSRIPKLLFNPPDDPTRRAFILSRLEINLFSELLTQNCHPHSLDARGQEALSIIRALLDVRLMRWGPAQFAAHSFAIRSVEPFCRMEPN